MQNRKLIAMCLALAGSVSLAMSVEPAQAKEKKLIKIKIEREVVMADELMLNGKFSDAADLYHAVQAKNPKSVPATIGFGMALAKQFKLDAADEQFNKALTMDPHNAMAHAGKAMVMFNRLASS
jgi:Tfp pilus assembly protein PilF